MATFNDVPNEILNIILSFTYIPITLCKKMLDDSLSTVMLPEFDFSDNLVDTFSDADYDIMSTKSYTLYTLFPKKVINYVFITNNKNLICIPEETTIRNLYVEDGVIPAELSLKNVSNLVLKDVQVNNINLISIDTYFENLKVPKFIFNTIKKYVRFTLHSDDEKYFTGIETNSEEYENILFDNAELMGSIKYLPNLISLSCLRCFNIPHIRSLDNLLHLNIIISKNNFTDRLFISHLPKLLSLNIHQDEECIVTEIVIIISDINTDIEIISIDYDDTNIKNIFTPLTFECGNKLNKFMFAGDIENKKLEDVLRSHSISKFCLSSNDNFDY